MKTVNSLKKKNDRIGMDIPVLSDYFVRGLSVKLTGMTILL